MSITVPTYDQYIQTISSLDAKITQLDSRVKKLEGIASTLYCPLFLYPGTNGIKVWQQVADCKKQYPTNNIDFTVNPSNGDFQTADPNFVKGIQTLSDAGVNLLAYVYTLYGQRDIDVIKRCIDAYLVNYPLVRGGIWLDEMPNTPGKESYVADISSYCHDRGFKKVYGNPGTKPCASYLGTVDTICTMEYAGIPSEPSMIDATFNGRYDRSNFTAIFHSVSAYQTDIVKTVKKYFANLYVTNDVMQNPYDTLSPYMPSMCVDLQK